MLTAAGSGGLRSGRRGQGQPRKGGGTSDLAIIDEAGLGLSPQGRGNPLARTAVRELNGTIPAGAGEPHPFRTSRSSTQDYPRRGGGTCANSLLTPLGQGLSPQGRGNLLCSHVEGYVFGTIPAGAGEPSSTRRRSAARWDYPRRGGGTRRTVCRPSFTNGLSPQGRGNPSPFVRCPGLPGTIPAGAGEPAMHSIPSSRLRDYPRRGGGTLAAGRPDVLPLGLSPQGRGNPW